MPTASSRLCARCGWIGKGRCPNCTKDQARDTDQRRGTSTERGYGRNWRYRIRPAFLRANPLCVLCGALASVPDHWPLTRKSLIEAGVLDPDGFHRLRPLCKTCHDRFGLNGTT